MGLIVADVPTARQLDFANRLKQAGALSRSKALAEKAMMFSEGLVETPPKTLFSRLSTGASRFETTIDSVLSGVTVGDKQDWSGVASAINGSDSVGHGSDGLKAFGANMDAIIEKLVSARNEFGAAAHKATNSDGEWTDMTIKGLKSKEDSVAPK